MTVMRLKNTYLFIFLLGLFACQPKARYSIDGTLPNPNYNGQQMYLVPFVGASVDNVDSCTIENSRFHFEDRLDSVHICILRPGYQLRKNIQDALVVLEKGKITVRIDTSSLSSGTPNNDLLQSWKENKEKLDRELYTLAFNRSKADSLNKIRFTQQIDSMQQVIIDYNYRFIRNNKGTKTAEFVGSLFKKALSKEQRTELGLN